MSSSHSNGPTFGPSPAPDLALQLIAENDWVRRLARSMVRCEADADDLSQDAVVDALESHQGSSAPSRVRAWLGTVLRRRVVDHHRSRTSRRDALEQLGMEATAASKTPIDSEERFALHEELAGVLRGLPKEQRDLILRRHVDQVPPRELAKELGLTSEQVRKRLLRAMDHVRRELRATERGEAGWHCALVGLAAPTLGGLGPPLAPTASPTSSSLASSSTVTTAPSLFLSLITMSITKKVAAVAAVLVLGALGWRVLIPGPVPVTAPPTVSVAPAPTDDLPERLASPERVADGRASRLAVAGLGAEPVVPADAPPKLAQIRIVDELGAAVPDADGVWLDSAGEVHAFEVDDQGLASLPASERVQLFAKSDTLCAVCVDLPPLADGQAQEIVLPPRPTLFLKLTVDGERPGEPIAFTCYASHIGEAVSHHKAALIAQLKAHGFPPARPRPKCSPDGIIRVEMPESAESAGLRLQDGYAVKSVTVNGSPTALPVSFEFLRVPLDEPAVHIDLFGLPSLVGRLVWADSRGPVAGNVIIEKTGADLGSHAFGTSLHELGSDGRFRASLTPGKHRDPGEWRALSEREGGIQLSDFTTERALRINVWSSADGAVHADNIFDIPGDVELFDVGDVLVQRLSTLDFIVLGRVGQDWVPVQAAVASPRGAVKASADGKGTVPVFALESLDVLAAGFDMTRVQVLDAHIEAGDPMEIRLEPAPLLEVQVPIALLDPTGRRSPQLKISTDDRPFGSWTREGEAPLPMGNNMHAAYFGFQPSGFAKVQSRYALLPVPASGLVQVPGIRKGAAFEIALADHQNEVYTSQSIVFDGAMRVSDWPGALEPAMVEISLVDTSRQSPLSGRFRLKAVSNGSLYTPFENGSIQAGPLAPGLYELTVLLEEDDAQSKSQTFNDITLIPGPNRITRDLALD